MKSDILHHIAQAIYAYKPYPEPHEIESVAAALVLKHPCLTEPGSGKAYEGWLASITYKLGNYRSKLRAAGCAEVNVNKRARDEESEESRKTMKKSKRGEVNYLPDHPEGENDDSLEEDRLNLLEEVKKRRGDPTVIREKMQHTFSLRRKEIVKKAPMVSEVQERWPALFCEDEVCICLSVCLSVCIFACVHLSICLTVFYFFPTDLR